jgi:hypothetical protein
MQLSGPAISGKGDTLVKRIRQARAWPPAARIATAIIATAVLVMMAAACSSGSPSSAGSGGSSNAGGSPTSPSGVGYSACVRSHGVPDFPDPDSNGQIPKTSAQQLGVSSSQLQAALTACRPLLPSSSQAGPPAQAELRQAWSATRNFAWCMRSHGVSNWPDPTSDPAHHPERPTFNLPVGIDQNSPQITTKISECEPLLHGWDPYVNSAAGQTFLNLS